ncbi:MAG: hypothetical protein MJZ57_01760 [Bacteroidales bacterium]|nr:hypothetical protein [Bacteroidales bacterium]
MKKRILLVSSCCFLAQIGFSQTAIASANGDNMGVPYGECDWETIQKTSCYENEMAVFYDTYKVESRIASNMAMGCSNAFLGYQMKAVVYFAAWNNDSHEMLPAFIRFCEELNDKFSFPIQYTLVSVDRTLSSHDANYEEAHIHGVPTIQLHMEKISEGQVVDKVDLGEFTGELKEETWEAEIYMIFARYMKYRYR